MTGNNSIFIIFAFVVALVISYITTPIAQKLSFKLGAVDVPKDNRRMHKEPKALLGGLAIFYGFLISVLCFGEFTFVGGTINRNLIGILSGSVVIVILGMFDDIKPRPALLKFLIQIAAALVPVLLGVRVFAITNPLNGEFLVLPTWLSIAGSVLWIVGVTNAVNLIDGLDGLAAGVSSIAAVALISILLIEHNMSVTLLVMAAALAGSCFGFLPYNFNPAKLFMGDTGATFLGFILACISIQGPFKTYMAFVVPFLVLGLPIFDTLFAIVRRILKRQPIMAPDRGHLHHKLIDRGYSHKSTVIILYGLSAVLAISAIVMLLTNVTRALILLVSVVVFGLLAFTTMNYIDREQERNGTSEENKSENESDKIE